GRFRLRPLAVAPWTEGKFTLSGAPFPPLFNLQRSSSAPSRRCWIAETLAKGFPPLIAPRTTSPSKGDDNATTDIYNVEAADIILNEAQVSFHALPVTEAAPIYEQLLCTFPTAKNEEEEGKKKEVPRTILTRAPSLPAGRPRAVAALAHRQFFSCARRRNVSPRGEKDRGDRTSPPLDRYVPSVLVLYQIGTYRVYRAI
ncbi:hypothetical protein BHE74_00011041, partial [Ensete ventricosum]